MCKVGVQKEEPYPIYARLAHTTNALTRSSSVNGHPYNKTLRRMGYDVPFTSVEEGYTPYSNTSSVVVLRSHAAPPINGRLAVVYTPKCRSRFQRRDDILSANHSSVLYVRNVKLYPYHDLHVYQPLGTYSHVL